MIKENVNKQKIAITVVIPVFNSETYLKECLNSVCNQTLKNIEIICINDGSADRSGDILNEYAMHDFRIKIFTQLNRGVSIARNFAIEKACGEYISFVDSDDFIDINYFEKLYFSAKKYNADIAAACILRLKGKKKKYLLKFKKEIFESDIKMKYKLLKLPHWSFSCCKIYKTSELKSSGIRFQAGVFYEDIVFINRLVHKLKKLVIVPGVNYYYRVHSQSITNTVSDKHRVDAKNAAVAIQKLVQDEGTMSAVGKHWNCDILKEKSFLGLKLFSKLKFGKFIQYRIFNIPFYLSKMQEDLKIDLVYLWVDSNDKVWRQKRDFWLKSEGQEINECRYLNNQELKYSLRSIEQNSPWINQIFIITDCQIPDFLDTSNTKIKFIDHKEIIPEQFLPSCGSYIE